MKYLLLMVLFLGFITSAGIGQTHADKAKADSLFINYHEKEALEAYNTILASDPDNLTALWRSSLLYSRVGNRFKEKKQKKGYFNKARERAQQALGVDSANSQANFVMAVAMGRMALVVGAKERVAASRDIKKYADRALQADSLNAGAWHVLGRWNYEISNLNFAERLAANVLFGGIPDGASTKNAIKYIQKAISLNPDFMIYYRDLANAYKELGEDDEAVAACRAGLKESVEVPDDKDLQKDCRKIIDDLN